MRTADNSPRAGAVHALHLPAGYQDSRSTFLALAARSGAATRSFPVPQDDPHGLPLFTDTAYLGPEDAPGIVVIASATHGVEGYAGATCQFRFLQAYPQRYAASDTGFLLVHAVNPWGYAHDSRVTEEGVDLNRNFVDFPLPALPRSGYGRFHDLLVTDYRPFPRGLFNQARLLSHGMTAASRRALQSAVTAGQYAYPDGLFFGGHAPSRSRRIWEEIVRILVAPHPAALLLDLHTGLGKRGMAELMSELPESAANFQEMSRWFGGGLKSMSDGDSVSPALSGTLTSAFIRSGSGRYALGLEFGTCSPLTVLNALRADQWYRNNQGQLSPRQERRVRNAMKRAFAVQDRSWIEQVVNRFEEVVTQIAAGLDAKRCGPVSPRPHCRPGA